MRRLSKTLKEMFDIKHHIVASLEGANQLDHLLKEGWKINPHEKIERTDEFILYPLVYTYAEIDPELLNPTIKIREKGDFEDVEAVIDCTHESVEGLVKQGYKVHQIYQKNVIMIKQKESK